MSDGGANGATPSGDPSTSEWLFDEPSGKPRESCVKYFDALWFCYSPVYQMQQLYRYGEVDDCTGRWRDFYDCLKKRTKFADQVLEKGKAKPIWQIRKPDEASAWWQEQFGHLRMSEHQQAPPQGGLKAAEAPVIPDQVHR